MKSQYAVAGGMAFLLISLMALMSLLGGSGRGQASLVSGENQQGETATFEYVEDAERTGGAPGTGTVKIGKFSGTVSYDEQKDYYFLEMRGARFPFKSNPKEAAAVKLEAPGQNATERNTALLYTMMGAQVDHATILVDPAEEQELVPAISDVARYMQIVNRRKFAGLAYTAQGGKVQNSALKGPPIQSLEEHASSETPIIRIRGPKGGAAGTRIQVREPGRVIVEGETYEDVYNAADFVGLTLLKMLCGSSDCPDAAACATGGDCGC